MNIQAATIFDELAFDGFDYELKELIRRLVRSGYLGTPWHVQDMVEDAEDRGYHDGFKAGADEAKDKLKSELEQILCGECFSAVSSAP